MKHVIAAIFVCCVVTACQQHTEQSVLDRIDGFSQAPVNAIEAARE